MIVFLYYSLLGTLFFSTLITPRYGIVTGFLYTWVFFSLLTLAVMGIAAYHKARK